MTKKETLKRIDELRAVIEKLPDNGVKICCIDINRPPDLHKVMVRGINKIISAGIVEPENIKVKTKLGRLKEKRVTIDGVQFWQFFNHEYFDKLRLEL